MSTEHDFSNWAIACRKCGKDWTRVLATCHRGIDNPCPGPAPQVDGSADLKPVTWVGAPGLGNSKEYLEARAEWNYAKVHGSTEDMSRAANKMIEAAQAEDVVLEGVPGELKQGRIPCNITEPIYTKPTYGRASWDLDPSATPALRRAMLGGGR